MAPGGFARLEQGLSPLLHEGELIEVVQPVRSARPQAAGVAPGSAMAMAITDQRLLLCAARGEAEITGLLAELTLNDVESIEVRRVMLGVRKRIIVSARGGCFEVEVPGRQAAELFERALIASGSADAQ